MYNGIIQVKYSYLYLDFLLNNLSQFSGQKIGCRRCGCRRTGNESVDIRYKHANIKREEVRYCFLTI